MALNICLTHIDEKNLLAMNGENLISVAQYGM